MSKKRGKSGTGSAGGNRWEQALLSSPFIEEDKWNASIALIVGGQVEDAENIAALTQTVATGTRRLFSVITQEELFAQVKELGNPKTKKAKDVPNNYEVCEPCKNHLDIDEEIPLPLLTKLIKFKLLDIKEKDKKRREAEKKAITDKDKGAKGGKDKKDRSKSPAKGKGGKKTPEPQSAKEGSKLKKRGEEDSENKYIDDEPDDGPQRYIFIHGFHHPYFLSLLTDININVDCIIKVKSEDYSRYEVKEEVIPEGEEAPEVPEKDEKTLALEEEARRKKEKLQKEIKKFWKDIRLICENAPAQSNLHNVAMLEYTVKDGIIPDNMEEKENADKKSQFGLALFEDTACMVYDMLDAKRQWKNYLDNLKLIKIPLLGPSAANAGDNQSQPSVTPGGAIAGGGGGTTDRSKGGAETAVGQTTARGDPVDGADLATPGIPAQTADVDMRYYNDLINSIPPESVSVPLIMHCMLEQVVATESGLDPPSEIPKAPRSDGLQEQLAQHVSSLAYKLALDSEEQEQLAQDFDSPKPPPPPQTQPRLIAHADDMSRRLQHLESIDEFDALKAELAMQGYSPISKLVSTPHCPSARIAKERSARLQELVTHLMTPELSINDIDQAFRQFVFESMNLTTTDEEGNIIPPAKSKQRDIPYDDPYPYFQGMMPPEEPEPVEKEVQSESPSITTSDSTASVDSPSARRSPSPGDSMGLGADAGSIQPKRSSSRQGRSKKRGGSGKKSKSSSPAAAPPPPPEEEAPKEDSRPSTPGILKRSDSASSRRPNSDPNKTVTFSHSVHFVKDGEEDDSQRMPSVDQAEAGEDDKTTMMADISCDSWNEINDVQKRNLEQWCFAEHHEPHVLLQIMKEAEYTLPFVDSYYHKRDNSLLVVLHNPHQPNIMQSKLHWETNLHSNVGFRNYLEQVCMSIEEWTLEEEAKYQATLLAKEVEKISKEAEEASERPSSVSKKGGARGKSPKKSPKRGAKSTSRPSSAEKSPRDPFVRQGSLKAWKAEQDAIKMEEEEKERAKSAKRANSRGGKKGKDEEKEEKKKGPGSSKGSAKSRISKEDVTAVTLPQEEQRETEKFMPFMGYDMGNQLLHVSGSINTMFPADGGQIRTEKINFKQGSTVVKSSVAKDGHVFSVHILDPKIPGQVEEEEEEEETEPSEAPLTEAISKDEVEEGKEKADTEKQEKEGSPTTPGTPSIAPEEDKIAGVGRFGSFTCQMKDGMSLALTTYGALGEPTDGKKYEAKPYVPPVVTSPSPAPNALPAAKGGKKQAKEKTTPEPPIQEEAVKPLEEEEKVPEQAFQPLTISCPDGLSITYLLESQAGIKPQTPDKKTLMVRQSYPFKSRGVQECEAARARAMQESSRLVTSNGTVIITRLDGSTQVLCADGTVSDFQPTSPVAASSSRSQSPGQRTSSAKSDRDTPSKKGKARKSAKKAETIEVERVDEVVDLGCWLTTTPTGEKVCHKVDGMPIPVNDCIITTATDPFTRQVMYIREDHMIRVEHPDGTRIVEHADGTRITTSSQTVQVQGNDADTGELQEAKEEVVQLITVESPGYATLKFDMSTSECSTEVGSGSVIHAFPEGYYDVYHADGGFLHIESDGAAMYYPRPNNDLEMFIPGQQLQYNFRHFGEVIVESVDNEGNVFNVTNTGESVLLSAKGESVLSQEIGQQKEGEEEMRKEKSIIEEKEIVHYKQHAPRLFVIHPDGSGTELLRYHDVAEYVSMAEEEPTTAIVMDQLDDFPNVLGITVLKPYSKSLSEQWLKPYAVGTITPPGLLSRDLRSLPAKEEKKEGPSFGTTVGQGLSVGASQHEEFAHPELLSCPPVLEVRQILQYKPVTPTLREQLWQGLKKYAENLRQRLRNSAALKIHDPRTAEEIERAEMLSQSVLPPMVREKTKIEGNVKGLYEKATAPPLPSPPPTPQPKRTQADWERDQRELAEELANRKALREHDVPKYFDSQLGKAFLLTQAPDMTALAKELAADPRTDQTRAIPANRADASNMVAPAAKNVHTQPKQDTLYQSNCDSTPFLLPQPPSAPTPKQSENRVAMPNDSQQQIPEETPTETYEPIQSADSDIVLTKSLVTNVTGEKRKEQVQPPAYLYGGRPNAQSNKKYEQTERGVRRTVNTSSVAGATKEGTEVLRRMRGFQLLPDACHMGVLREGTTYSFTVFLKNTGTDACRFKIKQPPPGTGVKVIYKPGPVAAGMKAELNIEIYAIAVGVQGGRGVGTVSHNLQITTETDVLYLPISATILTAHEYDNRGDESPKGGKSAGVKMLSNKPPGGQGIIRPRKDMIEGY